MQSDAGLNARAMAASSASCYFNPAFLVDADADLDLGVLVLSDQVGIRLNARPTAAADVPIESVDMERPGGGRYETYGIPTVWLEDGKPADPPDMPLRARPRQGAGSGKNVRVYQVVGLVRKVYGDRLAFGLHAMVPYSSFTGTRAFYSDEREQYFTNSLHPELYADRLTATSLAFGAGARVHPTLSLGLTFTLALRTLAVTPTYLSDVGRFDGILVDSDVRVNAAVAPHFGAVFKPRDDTRLTATVHTPQRTTITTDFSFLLPNGLKQRAKIRFTHAYLPWIFALGAEHDLVKRTEWDFSLVGSATYALWSGYVDRHSEQPASGYGWDDILAGVVGARYRRGPSSTFLDVTYQPSPVPNQTGRTNYVDNDRLGAALGYAYRFPLLGGKLRLGVQGQLHRLLPRQTQKRFESRPLGAPGDLGRIVDEVPDDAVVGGEPVAGREGLQTNNPGWPGFSSEGWILGAGVSASFTF